MTQAIRCTNCGAMMNPAWDGRVYACPFCRTQVQVAISGDQIAAGMALDFANVDAFLGRLAQTLWQGFGKLTYSSGRVQANASLLMTPTRSEGRLPAYDSLGPNWITTSKTANLAETTRKNTDQDWLKTNIAKFTGMMQG